MPRMEMAVDEAGEQHCELKALQHRPYAHIDKRKIHQIGVVAFMLQYVVEKYIDPESEQRTEQSSRSMAHGPSLYFY